MLTYRGGHRAGSARDVMRSCEHRSGTQIVLFRAKGGQLMTAAPPRNPILMPRPLFAEIRLDKKLFGCFRCAKLKENFRMLRLPKRRLYICISVGSLCALAGVSMIFDGKKGGWPVFGLFAIVAILCVVQLWPYHLWSRKSGPANELGMFPGPVTLRSNRVKSFIIALASSGLAGVFGWSLFNGSASLVAAVIYCSLSVGFSLSASVLLAATLNPNRLVLGPDSIDLHALLRRAKWRWQDIGGFEVGCTLHTSNPGFVYRRSSMVSFDDVNAPDTSVLELTDGFPEAGKYASLGPWTRTRGCCCRLGIGCGWKVGWRTGTRRRSWFGGRGSC